MAMLVGFNEAEKKYMTKLVAEIRSGNKTALTWMLEAYRLQDPYIRICPKVELKFEQDMIRHFSKVNPDVLAVCLDAFIEMHPVLMRKSRERQMQYWHVRALRQGWIDLVGVLWLAHTLSQKGVAVLAHTGLTSQEYGQRMLVWESKRPTILLPEHGLHELIAEPPDVADRAIKRTAFKVKNVLGLEVWKPVSAV